MGRLGNVVVLNGKSYSVDTGELLKNASSSSETKASVVQVEAIRRLTPSAPSKSKPTHVERHPNHTDLRQAHRSNKINVKSAGATKTTDPLSHKFAESSTKSRPKSLKSHRPATNVHTKLSASQNIERAPAPKTPRISHVSHMSKSKTKPVAKIQRTDLGVSQSESRRLRAAQHRRNEQISKFAAARREKSNSEAKQPDDNLISVNTEPTPELKLKSEHKPVRERIATANAPAKAAVATHHPRTVKSVSQIAAASSQTPVTEASQAAPQIKQADHGRAERFGLSGFAPAAAISVTVVAMVAYMAYLNVPNLAMRVAASRAGFDANMPAYTPSGFNFDGPIAYNSGQVVVDFTSNTDDRAYTVAQRKSNWNSESLLENVVKQEADKYLTFEDRGLTIYVYDGSNATWVNGGVWYTIKGDGSKLNSEQLVKIATSL